MARRGVLLVRSAYVLLVYISSERRFSLISHSGKIRFDKLLKSMGKPIGLVRSLFTPA